MTFLRHYIQILLPLLIGFMAYQFWIVPLLEPESGKQVAHWVHHQPTARSHLKWWEAYFVEGAWQRNNPLVIERDQSILLYQEREQISDTRWRFKPLTIVIPQETANGGKKAIFIENPKGAEIQFKTPFDWASGQPPPVVNGQLLGDIKIYSPGDDSSAAGELLIETRDLRIDKRQVWTTEPIQMRLGSSTIEGRYLSIYMDRDLLADASTTSPSDSSPFSGLDYLELFYVDRVEMVLKPGGLWPSRLNSGNQLRPATATLKCGGTFVFQFHQSQATLKNGVHMEHRVEGLPVDTFACQELKLTLGLPSAGSVPSTNSLAETNRWRIDRMEATGAPGRDINDQSNWVRMVAPGMQAEANGQHLIMDFVHGMVTLSNALPGTAPRNSSRVYLKRESLQISSPQIQVQNADLIRTSGEPALKRLGWVVADGIGIAQMDSAQESWSMRWSKRLVIRPHEERDLVQIEGGANISSSLRGRFIAETLNMWVLPVEGSLAQRLAPHFEGEKLPEFVPDAIAATGDVMVNSPELHAQVESMAIRFRYPDLPANAPLGEPREIELRVPTNASPTQQTSPSTASPTSVTQATAPATSMASFDEASSREIQDNGVQPGILQPKSNALTKTLVPTVKPKGNPLHVHGQSLEADIVRIRRESDVESMVLDGSFTLSRESVSDSMAFPLHITGERLHLQSESDDLTNIHMLGQPAKVAVGTGWMIANELQLSQSDQLLWVDHPGELVLPTEMFAATNATTSGSQGTAASQLQSAPNLLRSDTAGNSLNGQVDSIVWRSPPRLQWGERMTFDGKYARFGGGVTLDCRMQTTADTIWHVMGSASSMTLEMAQRIPLRFQPASAGSTSTSTSNIKPELQIVRLDGEVDIKAVQTDFQGARRSTENLLVPRIEFHVPLQTFVGLGPGQLLSRRMGYANPIANNPVSQSTPRTPGPASENGPSLQCLHLTFLGRVEGAMQQRMVSFFDKIDSLLGPITDWSGAVDVRMAETLAPNQSRLLCDQLNLFDASGLSYHQNRSGPSQAAWEIDALGNAQLASRTDSGDVIVDANRIGYAALDDAVRIEGSTRRGATIRRIPLGNQRSEVDEFQVSSATMRLKTGQLDAQIRRIEGSLPTQFQRPIDPQNPKTAPENSQPTTGSALPSPRDFNPLQPKGGGR